MATRSLPIFKNVVFFHKSELYTFQLFDLKNETLVFPIETLDTSSSNEPPGRVRFFNSLLPGHGRQSNAHEFYRAGGGHVETTHKLLCSIIRIRMFVRINKRYIKYKLTRLV